MPVVVKIFDLQIAKSSQARRKKKEKLWSLKAYSSWFLVSPTKLSLIADRVR
jgi:hypothetical protein